MNRSSVLSSLLILSIAFLPAACSSASNSPDTTGNATARGGERVPLSPKELVQRSKPAVVRIDVESSSGGGVGTGFFLTDDGSIATNLHVIKDATSVEIVLSDGTRRPMQSIAAIDAERDLAIIRIDGVSDMPTLALGNSDRVEAGDEVIAIGNPLGVLDFSVSDGLISAVRPLSDSLTVLQISAPISQGSSGGPLFNSYGEVIGVATAIISQGQNLNFGIPSNYLRPMMIYDNQWTLKILGEVLNRGQRSSAFGSTQQRPSRIQRKVPRHPESLLDSCSQESVQTAVNAISKAIENGAPLYNDGNHEACFRIYEGTAVRLESELQCAGVREALGQGLLRASTEEGYTLKAWAMRDAFDGVLLVAQKKYPNILP
ncbi:MAG: trypsin-like peptidase domain-containing protein [Myxococcota bacterium]